MRFTEHELTAALTGAAKTVAATQAGGLRRKSVDPEVAWQALEKFPRYQILAALGDQLLPVLAALPDVNVEPGTRPTFTDEQIQEALAQTADDSVAGRLKRKVVEASRMAMVKLALAHLPVRRDPDGLTHEEQLNVPDDLSGLM